MKKLIVFTLILSTLSAFAGDKKTGPCKEIRAACEAAGFVKGKHKEGKGLWKDCLAKIKNGEAVEGVSVSPEVIAACKDKKAARNQKTN